MVKGATVHIQIPENLTNYISKCSSQQRRKEKKAQYFLSLNIWIEERKYTFSWKLYLLFMCLKKTCLGGRLHINIVTKFEIFIQTHNIVTIYSETLTMVFQMERH